MLRARLLALALLVAAAGCKKGEAPETSARVVPRAPPPIPSVLEHEPDDVQHAQLIGPRTIVLGEITPGKRGAADDDWYRVVSGPGRLLALHVELAAAEPVPSVSPQPQLGPLDAQLEVDDRDRNRLVLTRATAGEPALLPAVACFESCFVHVWGTAPAAYQLTVLAAPPAEGQELEPNDRAVDATPLAAGQSVQGTIGSPDDEDWFRLTAQARPGQFLRVELSGVPGVRPELELRALSDGALLASFRAEAEGEGIFLRDLSLAGDLPPPAPPQLRPLPADAGTAPAGAALDGGAAALDSTAPRDAGTAASTAATLIVAGAAVLTGTPLTAAAPATIAPAAQASGAPGPHGSSNINNVGNHSTDGAHAVAPDALALDAGSLSPAPAAAGKASPGPAAQERSAQDPAAQEHAAAAAASRDGGTAAISSSSDAGPAQAQGAAASASNSAADAGVPAVQGYYLVVRSAPLTGEKRAPRGANPRAPYSLATALEAGPGDLEAEPNDDPQHATWIASTRTGFLAPEGDSDWYRVRNEGKSVLRAEVSGLSRADLELSIYAPPAHPGEKPALLARANEGGVREGELLPAVGIDGDALVLVQCAPRELDGVKVRDCEDRDSPYTLSVALAADDGALEREPNDDLEHAQPLALPAHVTGTLWPRRDVDVFRFQLDAPRSLNFRLSAVRGVDTMLTLRELKTSKKGRETSEVIGTADASRGEGPEEILAVPLKAGTYAIEVSSPRHDGSATQPYQLSVQ